MCTCRESVIAGKRIERSRLNGPRRAQGTGDFFLSIMRRKARVRCREYVSILKAHESFRETRWHRG